MIASTPAYGRRCPTYYRDAVPLIDIARIYGSRSNEPYGKGSLFDINSENAKSAHLDNFSFKFIIYDKRTFEVKLLRLKYLREHEIFS